MAKKSVIQRAEKIFRNSHTMNAILRGGFFLWVLVGLLALIYLLTPSVFDIIFNLDTTRTNMILFVPEDLNNDMADDFFLVRDITIGILIIALVLALYVLPVAMMLEACFTKKSFTWKLFWVLSILILGIVGMVLYWFFGRKNLRSTTPFSVPAR